MKKIISLLLAVLMVVSVLPVIAVSAAELPDGAAAVTFSGDGDWITANANPDNTQSYEIGYDIELPVVASCSTPDTWCDTAQLYIRNVNADNYFKFEIQSYCTGGGQYQIATSAQVWTGSSWSNRPFEWSNSYASPVSDVHVVLAYDADTKDFTWTVTNNANGDLLKQYTFGGAMVTADLASCASCELKMYRNNNGIAVSDAYILYISSVETESFPISFAGSDWMETASKADNSRNYEIGVDFNLPALTACSTPNSWCDDVQLIIRNEQADNYFKFQLQSYVSGGGKYQTYASAQAWDNANRAWSSRPDNWSANYDEAIENVKVTVAYNKDDHSFTAKVTNADTGVVLNQLTFAGSNLTEEVYTCEACQLRLYRNSTSIVPANAYIEYELEPTVSPAEVDWSSDSEDFSGWAAIDRYNVYGIYAAQENHRMWTSLLGDGNLFTAEADITVDNTSSAYIKVRGNTLEIDGRNGNGNQAFIKFNGENKDWLSGTNGTIHVAITAANGGLTYTLTGKNNGTPMTFSASFLEDSSNVEIGIYEGTASFENIEADVTECSHNWVLGASSAATCIADGSASYTCSICGAAKTETVPATGHSFVAGEVVLPNCTEQGYTVYTCTCGATENRDFVPALGHDYTYTNNGDDHTVGCSRCAYSVTEAHTFVEGVCVCGAEEVTENIDSNLTFATVNLQLESYIGADFFFLKTKVADYDSYYVRFTYPTADGDVTEDLPAEEYGKYFFAEHTVAAKEMSDTIQATIYAVKDGVTFHGPTTEWTLKNAMRTKFDGAKSTEADKALCVAILNYGAKAQARFSYNVEDLATSVLTAEEIAAYLPAARAAVSVDATTSTGKTGVSFYKMALSAGSVTVLNIMFTKAAATDIADVECRISYTDRAGTAQVEVIDSFTASGSRYVALFNKLTAKQLGDTISITFYSKTSGEPISETKTFSEESYIALNPSANEAQTALYTALIQYADAAAAKFA